MPASVQPQYDKTPAVKTTGAFVSLQENKPRRDEADVKGS